MDAPPPATRWHTREDSGIRLDRHLRWWHDDAPVEHPKIVEAFNRGLTLTEDGGYQLRFGNDWCIVEVEDAAFEVRTLEPTPAGVLLSLSDRTEELLDVSTMGVGFDGAFTCRVKAGRARARFSRPAHIELGQTFEERGGRVVVTWPGGEAELPALAGEPTA